MEKGILGILLKFKKLVVIAKSKGIELGGLFIIVLVDG